MASLLSEGNQTTATNNVSHQIDLNDTIDNTRSLLNDTSDSTRSVWQLYYPALSVEYTAMYFVIFLIILINNIVVLAVFCRMKSLSPLYQIIVGLAIADLLTLVPYGISMATVAAGKIWMKQDWCDIVGVVRGASVDVTTWLHCMMCIEKCFSVTQPVKYRNFSSKRVFRMANIAGIVCVGFAIPLMTNVLLVLKGIMRNSFVPYEAGCRFAVDIRLYRVKAIMFLVPPLIIQIVTHAIILKKVYGLQSVDRASTLKAIRVVTLTLALYYMCWSPIVVNLIWNVAPGSNPPAWFEVVTGSSITLNSGMSAIIYGTSLEAFRKTFRQGCCCFSERKPRVAHHFNTTGTTVERT